MPDVAGLPASSRSATGSTSSARWWSPSRAAPTRRSSPWWPTTPSAPIARSPSPRCRRRSPASERVECAALAAALGPGVAGGRDRRARQPRLRPQRRRPLLLVQGRAPARPPGPIAEARGATVVLGVNVDDLGDHRPGQRAAAERGAAFPLVDAGFTKADVRAWSKAARPRDLGQAGGRLPGVPAALRHAGHARPAGLGRAGRGGAPRPRVRASCGCATTATSPGSRCRSATSNGWSAAREAVVDAVRGGGLPLGHPRPRRPPLRRLQRHALA